MLHPPGTPLRLTEVRRFARACLQPPHSHTHMPTNPAPPALSDAASIVVDVCAGTGRFAIDCCVGVGAVG